MIKREDPSHLGDPGLCHFITHPIILMSMQSKLKGIFPRLRLAEYQKIIMFLNLALSVILF